jgi:hypothetical protein
MFAVRNHAPLPPEYRVIEASTRPSSQTRHLRLDQSLPKARRSSDRLGAVPPALPLHPGSTQGDGRFPSGKDL